MKTFLFTAVTCLFGLMTNAQTVAFWEGGTPGKENVWNESRNWSNNMVPDENTVVYITSKNTGHDMFPVITHDVEVLGIELHQGSRLEISGDAKLLIDGTNSYTEGIKLFGGKLINNGSISLINLDSKLHFMSKGYSGTGNLVYNANEYVQN